MISKMKAIIYEKFGPPEVLFMSEVIKPVPNDKEILIKVKASSVGFGDLLARNFKAISPAKFYMPLFMWIPSKFVFVFGKPKIKILGSQYSGIVEAIGSKVTRYKKGDEVFAYTGPNMGGYADATIPEGAIVSFKPRNMSFEDAACVPYGAVIALNILRKINIKKGDKILINGASGSIGSATIQLAKISGAEVTGVSGTNKIEYVKAIGADRVIDYNKVDFTKEGIKYDFILDILGKSSFEHCRESLKKEGVYLLASFKMKQLLQMLWTKISGSKQKVICALSMEKQSDLEQICKICELGKYKVIIDKSFPLKNTAEAHLYLERGQEKGSVAILINN
jgi:NADPH:quinone reductase-like Zn-dependent oxidoreductase